MRLVLLFVLVFFTLFVFVPHVTASDDILKFKVNHVAGIVEKIEEKLSMFFKFDAKSKADYSEYLSEKRLAELSYVISAKNDDMVEPTASRYSTYIGLLAKQVESNKLTSKKNDLLNMFDRHVKILTALEGNYKADSGWWLAIQNDINTDKIFLSEIKNL